MLDTSATILAGAVLLSVVAIEYGGTFLLRVSRGIQPTNELQKNFFRAGHAHAGILVILGLVVVLLTHLANVSPLARGLSEGVLLSAILIPAGFFLSVLGSNPARPSRLIALLWAGVVSLTVGLVAAGAGLIVAGAGR